MQKVSFFLDLQLQKITTSFAWFDFLNYLCFIDSTILAHTTKNVDIPAVVFTITWVTLLWSIATLTWVKYSHFNQRCVKHRYKWELLFVHKLCYSNVFKQLNLLYHLKVRSTQGKHYSTEDIITGSISQSCSIYFHYCKYSKDLFSLEQISLTSRVKI